MKVWVALRCLMVCLAICVGITLPVQAASAAPFLTLSDLPEGFVQASEAEASSCQMAGERVAFVFRSPTSQAPAAQKSTPTELVCASSFSLAATTDNAMQAELMRQGIDSLLKNPQAFMAQVDSDHQKELEILNWLKVGEQSIGFKTVEAEIGQTEVVLFRRGNFLNAVLIRSEAGSLPIASLKALAQQLDQRIAISGT
jgi:hypothetical protein